MQLNPIFKVHLVHAAYTFVLPDFWASLSDDDVVGVLVNLPKERRVPLQCDNS